MSDQSWGVDRLIKNKGKVSFTIPSCIASGQYLLRHEIIGSDLCFTKSCQSSGSDSDSVDACAIALHAASSYPGAQFYMECAQINVTGGSGAKSPSTVSFPGAYKGTDSGKEGLSCVVRPNVDSSYRCEDQHLPDTPELYYPR